MVKLLLEKDGFKGINFKISLDLFVKVGYLLQTYQEKRS